MVRIRAVVVEALITHAADAVPNECCGFLLGTAGCVEQENRARNLVESPTRYRINPEDHFAAIHAARRVGWDVVGVYHSHPDTSPTPSRRDLAEATYPDYLYLIVSPRAKTGSQVRGFRLRPDGYADVPLECEPSRGRG